MTNVVQLRPPIEVSLYIRMRYTDFCERCGMQDVMPPAWMDPTADRLCRACVHDARALAHRRRLAKTQPIEDFSSVQYEGC